MVVIRLSRKGTSKNAFYHVMVADRRRPRDGRFIECVGYYNPMARGQEIRLKLEAERIQHWMSKGAQPSPRVSYLMNQLLQSPEQAQQAGPRRGELKRQQAEQAAKALKTANKQAKEETEAVAETPETSETPAEETKE